MMQQSLTFGRKMLNEAVLVSALMKALEGRGWVKSKVLEAELGLTDRGIRHLAHASDGFVISGQLGYRLTAEASESEAVRAANWRFSQSREMVRVGHRILAVHREAMHQREAV